MLGLKKMSLRKKRARTFNQAAVEAAAAVAAVLRGVGEATYDKDRRDEASVSEDYKTSPSWPGALILHADQLPKIWELFIQERDAPHKNVRAWKAHEEKLNVRRES